VDLGDGEVLLRAFAAASGLESKEEFRFLARGTHAAFLESILKSVLDLEKFTPDTPITRSFRKAHFASGHDLKQFAEKLGIDLQTGDVEQ